MPDLDLIEQAEQGRMRFVGGQSGDLERAIERLQPTRATLLLILLQEQQTGRQRFNEWLWPVENGFEKGRARPRPHQQGCPGKRIRL